MLFRDRQQIMIFFVGGAIVCVFMLFWYLPLQKRMKAVRQNKAAQTFTIAKGTADSKQLSLLEEQLQKMQAELGNYEARIPERIDIGVFLSRIADLMNEHNLKEQVITPSKEVEADNLNCIPVSMQCRGKLAQIFNFYQKLQKLDRLVRIEQVKLCNDSDFSGEVSMETKAVIYYRGKLRQG